MMDEQHNHRILGFHECLTSRVVHPVLVPGRDDDDVEFVPSKPLQGMLWITDRVWIDIQRGGR